MMKQMFFISPNGYPAVRAAFTPRIPGACTHGWAAEGLDPSKDKVIGVVEMTGTCDPERVIDALEGQGIMWLPDHKSGEPISDAHAAALAEHGVQRGHTSLQAMTLVNSKAGFPPLKPKRF